MIKVENEIVVYEVDGISTKSFDTKLKLSSHWNEQSKVVLELEGGRRYTVVAKDLIAAISNATNTALF